MSSVLFELLVKIKTDGIKGVEKDLAALEKKAEGAEKGWDDFNKKFDKNQKDLSTNLKKINDNLTEINKNTKTLGKDGTKSMQDLGKATGDTDKQFITLSKDADKTWKGIKSGADDATKSMDAHGSSIDKTRKQYQDLDKDQDRAFSNLDRNLANNVKSTRSLNDTLADTSRTMEGASRNVDDFGRRSQRSADDSTKAFAGVRDEMSAVDRLGDTLANKDIRIRMHLEGQEKVIEGIDFVKEHADELERDDIQLRVTLQGNEEVIADLSEIDGLRMRIDGNDAVFEVRADNAEQTVAIMEQVEAVKAKLSDDVEFNVKADISDVETDTAAVVAEKALLSKDVEFEVKADVDNASQQMNFFSRIVGEAVGTINSLNEKLHASNTVFGQLERMTLRNAGMITLWTTAIGAALVAVEPLLGGLATLGSLLVTGAGGFGLLAAAAYPLGKALSEVHDAQKKVSDQQLKVNAAQQRYDDLVASGDIEGAAEAYKQVQTETKNLEKKQEELNTMTEAYGPAVEQIGTKASEFMSKYVEAFRPATGIIADLVLRTEDYAISTLPRLGMEGTRVAGQFRDAFNEVVQRFQESAAAGDALNAIFDAMGPVVYNLSVAAGDFALGLLEIFGNEAVITAAQDLSGWIADIAQYFADWAGSEEGVSQIAQAVEEAEPVFSALWDVIRDLVPKILELGDHAPGLADEIRGLGEVVGLALDDFDAFLTVLGDIQTAIEELTDNLPSSGEGIRNNLINPLDDSVYHANNIFLPGYLGAFDKLMEELVGSSILPDMVDRILEEEQRMVDESEPIWQSLYDKVTGWAQDIFDYVVGGSTFPELTDASLVEFQRLVDEGDPIWSTLYDDLTQYAQDIYDYIVGGSTFVALTDDSLTQFQRLVDEGDPIWSTLYDNLTQYAQDIYDYIVGGSTFVELTTDSVAEFQRLRDEGEPIWTTLVSNVVAKAGALRDGVVSAFETMVEKSKGLFDTLAGYAASAFASAKAALLDESPVPEIRDGVIDAFNEMGTQSADKIQTLVDSAIALFEQMRDGTLSMTSENINSFISLWNKMPDELRLQLEPAAQLIADTLGVSLFEDLTMITNEGMDQYQNGIVTGAQQTAQGVVGAYGQMAGGVTPFISQMIQAIGAMAQAMAGVGAEAGIAIGPGNGFPGATIAVSPTGGARAKGGVDEAEAQGSTGGVSSGSSPRVVFGEQSRNTKEAYIVQDREDNLPYLAEAASWFGYSLVPGMASGGLYSQIGKTYDQVPHIPPPEPEDTAAKQSTVSGAGGAATTGTKKLSRKQRRRQRRRERRQSRTTTATGTSAATPTGTSAAPSTGAAPSTAPSTGTTPTMGTTADTGTGSPSQQAFPSSCGNLYPVASPTESGQVPYRDAALSQSGMVAAVSSADVGADHVNAPADMTHPGDASGCGVGGSGSSNMPYPSTPLGGPGTATIPYNQCLPAHVTGMAAGGTTGTGGATDQAYPLDWQDTPLGYWSSALGYAWPGDPSLDWPTLLPPAGWDPSVWYYTGANGGGSTGMARGGILRNGVRHFQGGGLNTYQLDAGNSAASSVLGSPYSYGHAGDDGGFDCSGLWQYIYTAVVDGAPTPDVRWWGTYSWAGGFPGGEGVPGPIEGAMNVYTDLSGWEGDDTHTSGDIMGSPYEAIFAGVSGSSSASGADGIWSIGDPSSIGQWGPVSPDYAVDPAATMGQEVSDWWLCQAPAPVDIGAAPMFGPVESWMANLPGMTEPFLQDAGQQSIGTLGSGAAGGTGTTTTDYIIAALQSVGMDTTSDAIASLEALIACESSGDPSATSPDGAMGLTQLMPDTWSQFGVGGDPYDPIANIAASINYQLSRYGGLIDFCPYERGGLAMSPHFGLVGEGGREAMLPLDNHRAMSQIRAGLFGSDSDGLASRLDHLAERVDNVASRVDHQTVVVPPAIGGAVDSRIKSNPATGRAMNYREESNAMREIFRGGTR